MTEEIDISKCICIYTYVKNKSMTEEIDRYKCICIYTNSKNINQWLKKSILVSVYVYT
jgi:hypothetical protein